MGVHRFQTAPEAFAVEGPVPVFVPRPSVEDAAPAVADFQAEQPVDVARNDDLSRREGRYVSGAPLEEIRFAVRGAGRVLAERLPVESPVADDRHRVDAAALRAVGFEARFEEPEKRLSVVEQAEAGHLIGEDPHALVVVLVLPADAHVSVPGTAVVRGGDHRGPRIAGGGQAVGEVALNASVGQLEQIGFPVGAFEDDLFVGPGGSVVAASAEHDSAADVVFVALRGAERAGGEQVAVGQHDGIDGREAARVAALGGRDGVGFEQDSRVAPVQEIVARAVVDAGGDLPSLHEENVASVGHAFDARIDGCPVGFQLRGREQLPVGADRFEHTVPLRSGVGVQRRGGRVHLVERVQAHRSLFGLRGGRADR